MRSWIFGVAAAATLLASSAAFADNGFCAGYAAGWKATFENHGQIVGITPICPIPPMGRDSYQGGYEAGMLAAFGKLRR